MATTMLCLGPGSIPIYVTQRKLESFAVRMFPLKLSFTAINSCLGESQVRDKSEGDIGEKPPLTFLEHKEE